MRNALRSIARSQRNGHINLADLNPIVLVLPSRNRKFANLAAVIKNKPASSQSAYRQPDISRGWLVAAS
jgi:hypothetical protein